MISILKPRKDPALPSSYPPICLLDTIGKLFEKILLARVLHEVNVGGLMRNEQLGFRPRYNTSLHLDNLVERITRIFGEEDNRRSLPQRGQSLRYRPDRWPPLQANTAKLPVLHSPYNVPLPPRLDVLQDGYFISSSSAGPSCSGWNDIPCHL